METTCAQSVKCRRKFYQLFTLELVSHLQWIPRHEGIDKIEKADILTKQDATFPQLASAPSLQ